jgi:beta-glucosidase
VTYEVALSAVRRGADPDEQAKLLLSELTPEERLGLLDGDMEFWPGIIDFYREGYNVVPVVAGAVARLGIPGIRFADGPRGCVLGHSTCFPVSMARGATWDVDLEEQVGQAIGREIRAQGGNFFGGVCVNLLRHPAWGRAQETYGEDPVLLGEMGAALTRGAQKHVMACVKHFACNSMENARFTVDVTSTPRVLREVYLPHFRRVVEEGVASVMSAYNSVNGRYCGDSRELLTGVLREEWGFEGFVVSDFFYGLREPIASLEAGLDVEMPFKQQRDRSMAAAHLAGDVNWDSVDRAAARILRTQLRFDASIESEAPPTSVVASDAHRLLARRVASRSMVLLRNELVAGTPLLPLDPSALRHVVVVGELAAVANTGDRGSSHVRAPSVVTPLEGLRAALPHVRVEHLAGADLASAVSAARGADAVVVVVGFTADDEGEYVDDNGELAAQLFPPATEQERSDFEAAHAGGLIGTGGDRTRLTLRADDEEMIRAVSASNRRVIVCVVSGSAVLMEEWRHDPGAILMCWYAGMEGGHALASVLLGEDEPGGRLPFVVPTSGEHLPPFDKDATAVEYDEWHGYRKLAREGHPPAYPFGFGLAYTTFDLSVGKVEQTAVDGLTISVQVTNTGGRDGSHVVQVYGRLGSAAGFEASSDIAPAKLLGFARVSVESGGATDHDVTVSLRPLASWDENKGAWRSASGLVQVGVASHHGDMDAHWGSVMLTPE